jgi:hypothetical protein
MNPAWIVVGELAPKTDHLLAEAMLAKRIVARFTREAPRARAPYRREHHARLSRGYDARLFEQAERESGDDVDAAEAL